MKRQLNVLVFLIYRAFLLHIWAHGKGGDIQTPLNRYGDGSIIAKNRFLLCDNMNTMPTKRYEDDYETIVNIDDNGNEKKTAVYHGQYFELTLDQVGILRFKRNCILLLTAVAVLHISAGFVNNLGMYQFYVALPYVIAFFPMLFLAISVLRLPIEKRKYRRDEIGYSFDRMKTTSFILMAVMVIGVIGEIIFLLVVPVGDQIVLEYLYLSFEIPAAAGLYFLIRFQKNSPVLPIIE